MGVDGAPVMHSAAGKVVVMQGCCSLEHANGQLITALHGMLIAGMGCPWLLKQHTWHG